MGTEAMITNIYKALIRYQRLCTAAKYTTFDSDNRPSQYYLFYFLEEIEP